MNDIRHACMSFYHLWRDLNIHEWIVTSETGTKERGLKLFALTDSNNFYTVDLIVYKGKTTFPTGSGMSYDAVMSLMRPSFPGSGYHLYLDYFFSSPKPFKDLLDLDFGACQQETVRGYNSLFYHFVDMATTNSHVIHTELCKKDGTAPMTHQAFIEELTNQLCGVSVDLLEQVKEKGCYKKGNKEVHTMQEEWSHYGLWIEVPTVPGSTLRQA
ncbi:unnamed protein product [Coregonus sp. 'balchen']|nr:unnamed protein product [Coregonus sp. 'balchen']